MARYILRKDPLDDDRQKRVVKTLLEEGTSNREKALETYEYFKAMVDENPEDDSAKACMIQCLKLAQTARDKSLKLLEMVRKTNLSKKGTDKEDFSFESLLEDSKTKLG